MLGSCDVDVNDDKSSSAEPHQQRGVSPLVLPLVLRNVGARSHIPAGHRLTYESVIESAVESAMEQRITVPFVEESKCTRWGLAG